VPLHGHIDLRSLPQLQEVELYIRCFGLRAPISLQLGRQTSKLTLWAQQADRFATLWEETSGAGGLTELRLHGGFRHVSENTPLLPSPLVCSITHDAIALVAYTTLSLCCVSFFSGDIF
jgi:hypothetical protein